MAASLDATKCDARSEEYFCCVTKYVVSFPRELSQGAWEAGCPTDSKSVVTRGRIAAA
jgi:hypothetical protein